MKFANLTISAVFALVIATAVHAQEPNLVNEIVARVNNDIITLIDYQQALNDFRAELARQLQQQGKSEAEINAEFERLRPTVLDIMIEDLLLQQKAKELGIDVEAEVNQQWAAIAKENQLTIVALEAELKKQGIDPDAARASLRKRLQQNYVMNQEVLRSIYENLKEKDRREFYEKHKDYFTTPGEVTISEIFLPLEGFTAADVEQRARRIIAELRAGMNFAEAVQKYSHSSRASREQNGLLGTFKPGELKEEIEKAISTLKPGEVTEPIRLLQDGYQIIRVDERKPSIVRLYEDPKVQNEVANGATMERAEESRKAYLKRLREEAFIEITPKYVTAHGKEEKKGN
ncbi:MAG: peptidylprolyl isomerase [Blastocatellia bacterium]|nr:peptidylprolyl isomerase [Blastocatellia bacterium]